MAERSREVVSKEVKLAERKDCCCALRGDFLFCNGDEDAIKFSINYDLCK